MDNLLPELIIAIVELLPRRDILAVRQANKHIERSCFDYFANLFFRKIGFLIATESLEVLRSISHHDGLRKHVQHVWFNPDCFTYVQNPLYPHDPDDEECKGKGEDVLRRAKLFDEYVSDHHILLHFAEGRDILHEVFEALPKLRTVGMRRGPLYAPYGWRTIYDKVGQDPRVLGTDVHLYTNAYDDPTYLLIAIIKALASSRRLIRRLYTDAIQIDHIYQEVLPSGAEWRQALKCVQYLELNATGIPEECADFDTDSDDSVQISEPGEALGMLLSSMPDLFEIGMTLFRDPKQRHMIPPDPEDGDSWAETYPFRAFMSISNKLELQHLRRVKLEKLCTTIDALCAFLRPCSPVLMILKLRHIELLQPDAIDADYAHVAWQKAVRFLRDDCPAIEYLLLFDLNCCELQVRFDAKLRTDYGPITDDDDAALELFGHDEIVTMLNESPGHFAHGAESSIAMDDTFWHTDTSDEEW